MLGHLLLPELHEMISGKKFVELRNVLVELAPPDLAELIVDLPPEEKGIIFRILPRSLATEMFEYSPLDVQETLIKALAREQVADILNSMSPDDRTALLEELPAEVTRQVLSMLSPAELAVAKKLLGYPEKSIGRLMTPDYLAIRETLTVQKVLDYIRTHGRSSETLNYFYIIDNRGVLIDDIRVREILLAPLDKNVSELMDRDFVSLVATQDQEEAVSAFKKYDVEALPVTDSSGVLLGIVTVDDVIDVAEQEATEDFHKVGGSEALGEALDEPYLSIDSFTMIRKRAGWLVVLFLGEMLTASAMAFFEKEIARAVVLALFVPLIISSGGNSGSQASTLVIRALALGEVKLRDWWRVMRRELFSGLVLGMILGCIGFCRIFLWSMFTDLYGQHWLLVAATVWLALVGVVLWGTLAGAMLPMILKKAGADPATSSAPFVATLVDVTGLVISFSVAAIVLKGVLL
jgi:magnesium transporter